MDQSINRGPVEASKVIGLQASHSMLSWAKLPWQQQQNKLLFFNREHDKQSDVLLEQKGANKMKEQSKGKKHKDRVKILTAKGGYFTENQHCCR